MINRLLNKCNGNNEPKHQNTQGYYWRVVFEAGSLSGNTYYKQGLLAFLRCLDSKVSGNGTLSCIHRNPLRAGIVRRLSDYPWSSYPIYAYGKKSPEWLLTNPILSLLDTKNKHIAYRKIVQDYSREEKMIWENFRQGLFLGSKKFIDRIKSKYLSETLMLKFHKNGKC